MKNKFQIIELILLLQQNKQIIYNTRIITMTLLISNNELEEVIYYRYLKDKQAQRMLKELIVSFKKTFSKLMLFKELMYITEYQQTEII